MFAVAAGWMGHDARCRKLFDLLMTRLKELPADKRTQEWLTRLMEQHGKLKALKPLKVLSGLPEFPKIGLFGCLLDNGTPADLVVTTRSLLFCEPTFEPTCTITVLPRARLRSASIGWYDGSTLIIKTDTSSVRCGTTGQLDAKPIAQVITQELIHSAGER